MQALLMVFICLTDIYYLVCAMQVLVHVSALMKHSYSGKGTKQANTYVNDMISDNEP